MIQLWHIIWPGFDQVWPNILADLIFGAPAFICQHLALRRHHARTLAEHVEAVHRAHAAVLRRAHDIATGRGDPR